MMTRWSFLVLVLSCLYTSAAEEITAIHWNPHWQCFQTTCETCTQGAISALSQFFSMDELDFVHVVEFETVNLTLPQRWSAVAYGEASCGRDWDTLFYRNDKWTKRQESYGCVYPGRSYVAGVFEKKNDPNAAIAAVVGAHFPQTLSNRSAYEETIAALRRVLEQLDEKNVILLADTNTEGPEAAAKTPTHAGFNRTNLQLMNDLGLWSSQESRPPATPLYRGCCLNDGFQWQGDRIILNFGDAKSIFSRVLFENASSLPWVQSCPNSEFHKGVLMSVSV